MECISFLLDQRSYGDFRVDPEWQALEARAGALPSSAELDQWFGFAKEVELGLREGDQRFALELKKSGDGSSAYAKVRFQGEVVGAFLSENSSTCVAEEIATFEIGGPWDAAGFSNPR